MQKTGKQRLRSLSASVISLITVFAMTAQSAAEFAVQQEDAAVREAAGEQSEQETEQETGEALEEAAEVEQEPAGDTDSAAEEDDTGDAPETDADPVEEFEIEDGVLKKYNGNKNLVEIPSGVTEIGEGAFLRNTSIERVKFSESVEKIGKLAFLGCSNLSTVDISSNVSEIGESAFEGSGLYGIIIDGAESGDNRLQFPQKITKIEKNVFKGVKATNIVISDNIESIGVSAFEQCQNLATLNFENANKLQSIGDNAFASCPQLASLELSAEESSLQTIGNYAFWGCTSLTTVSITGTYNLTTIGIKAFEGCRMLHSVALTDNIMALGAGCFSGCASLVKINLPRQLVFISDELFWGCGSLPVIALPQGITSIGNSAFSRCDALEDVNILDESDNIIPKKVDEIPSKVISIGENAFSGCSSIRKLKLSDNLTIIGAGAFQNCSNLHNMYIPDGVRRLESYTFSGCSSLTEIRLSPNTTYLGDYVFSMCSVLNNINYDDENNINILPDTITVIGNYAFSTCVSLESIKIPKDITLINSGTFNECASLYNVKLNSALKRIGGSAFYHCYSLENITLPEGLEEIYDKAFMGSGLRSVILPDSVMRITDPIVNAGCCFMDCVNLETVTISENMSAIPRSTFENCTKLSYAYIPDNIAVVRTRAFYNCTSLNSVVFAQMTNAIEGEAFGNCTGLVKMIIPRTVQSILKNAFAGCDNLVINFMDTEQSWKQRVKDVDIGSIKDVEFNTSGKIYTNPILINKHLLPKYYVKDSQMTQADFGNENFIEFTEVYYENDTLKRERHYAPITLSMITGFDSSVLGVQTLTIEYTNDLINEGDPVYLTYDIEIIEEEADGIEVEKAPTKTQYYVGEETELDLHGASFKLTYPNGSTKTVNAYDENGNLNENISVSGFYLNAAGDLNVKIWYKQYTKKISTTLKLTVVEPEAVSVAMGKKPYKTTYYKDAAYTEDFDAAGATLLVTYNYGATKEEPVVKSMVSGFDSSTLGVKTLTVKYNDTLPAVTFDIEIINKVRSLEWVTEPSVTEYYVGDEVDVSGAKFKVTFENGDTGEVDVTADMVQGFSSRNVGVLAPSPYIVYGDKTLVFPTVTIKKVELAEIAVAKLPTKTKYEMDDTLDISGGQVKLIYNNGDTKNIPMTADMVTSTFNSKFPGKQKVVLKYEGFTTSFEVTVEISENMPNVILVKEGEDIPEQFDRFDRALTALVGYRNKATIYIVRDTEVKKMLLPQYADLTITSLGNAKLKTDQNKITTKDNLTIDCDIVNTQNKAITLTAGIGTTLNINKLGGISAIAGKSKSVVNINCNAELKSVSKIPTLNIADGVALTIPEKGAMKGVDKLSGRLIVKPNSTVVINDTDNAKIELMKKDDPRKGTVFGKLTLAKATGKATITAVDDKGEAFKLPSGITLFNAAKDASKEGEITANISIDPANGEEFGAVQYGKVIKAEYMHAIEMGGTDYSSLEKALEKATGTAVIKLKSDVTVAKLTLPNISGLTIDGGEKGYTVFVNAAVSASPKYPLTLKNMTLAAKAGAAAITLSPSVGDLTLENVKFTAKTVTLKGKNKAVLTNCAPITALTGFAEAEISGELTVTKTFTVPTVELTNTAVLNVVSGQKVTIKTSLKGAEGSVIKFESGFKPIAVSGAISGKIAIKGSVSGKQILTVNKNMSDTDLNNIFDLTAVSATAKLHNENSKVKVV